VTKHTVALVDDHHVVLQGLRTRLTKSGWFSVVGEYRSAAAALQHLPAREPEVIIVDLGLPDSRGTDVLPRLRAAAPKAKIVVHTMYDRADYVLDAVRAGVDGYVTKGTDPGVLVDALALVVRGEVFFDRPAMNHLLSLAAQSAAIRVEAGDDAYNLLTPREQEVLRLLAQGLSTKDIGTRLGISHRTAENHRSSMLGKLGLRSMVEVVRYAQRIGIVT
jgi:DNA-binding NarL/FixJ family response regulator